MAFSGRLTARAEARRYVMNQEINLGINKMKLDESKCLASLAVFRELHDSKKDVYEIISEFLLEIIWVRLFCDMPESSLR